MDTKELRRLARAATPGPWEFEDVGHKYVVSKSGDGWISREVCKLDGSTMSAFRQKENGPFIAAANPTTIEVLLDRLEAAEKERDELRAKIEQQKPVGIVHRYGRALNGSAWLGVAWNPEADELPTGTAIYALPGTKGEEK